jgi:hypothetical protein
MPYDGPYRVISWNKKTFVIDIKKKKVRVTIDRLKPSYIIVDDHSKEDISREIQTSTPNTITKEDQRIFVNTYLYNIVSIWIKLWVIFIT